MLDLLVASTIVGCHRFHHLQELFPTDFTIAGLVQSFHELRHLVSIRLHAADQLLDHIHQFIAVDKAAAICIETVESGTPLENFARHLEWF